MSRRIAVITGGHSFQAQPFFAIFDSLVPGDWHHVPFGELNCDDVDVVVFYDMPGIQFTRSADPSVAPASFVRPPTEVVDQFDRLMNAGVGLVFLHHAVAGWPIWDEYAEIIGARFHYQPAVLRGVSYPDSGYVHTVTHQVRVVDPTHRVCEGLDAEFDVTDELYCYPVFTDSVVPLLRTLFPVADASRFFSSDAAIRGNRESNAGWTHPAGSDLIGWVKSAGASPVVYLQCGDGPETYVNRSFRLLLSNAIAWAASSEAKAWALQG